MINPTPQDLKSVQTPDVSPQLGAMLAAADEAQRTAMGNPSDTMAQEQAFALRTAAVDLSAQQARHDNERVFVRQQNEPIEAALRAQNDQQTNRIAGDLAKVGLMGAFAQLAAKGEGPEPVVLGAGLKSAFFGGGREAPKTAELKAEEADSELSKPAKKFGGLAVAAVGVATTFAISPFSLFNRQAAKFGAATPAPALQQTGPNETTERLRDEPSKPAPVTPSIMTAARLQNKMAFSGPSFKPKNPWDET